jgi:methylated-DNA-[protein]-cysteine S-methyltransferase
MRKQFTDELIAFLLGDAAPSPALKRRLETEEGQRELKAYRETLQALESHYREVQVSKKPEPIYYTKMTAPIGDLFVAATDKGLVRISFMSNEPGFVSELRMRLNRDVVESLEKVSGVVQQLHEYFAGKRSRFSVAIDWSLVTPFQRRVLEAAIAVPAGHVASYGELARRIGQPGASRAVGNALGRNPVPIVIPCHRIVREGGGLGGYTGGLHIKKKLLQIEGAL